MNDLVLGEAEKFWPSGMSIVATVIPASQKSILFMPPGESGTTMGDLRRFKV